MFYLYYSLIIIRRRVAYGSGRAGHEIILYEYLPLLQDDDALMKVCSKIAEAGHLNIVKNILHKAWRKQMLLGLFLLPAF